MKIQPIDNQSFQESVNMVKPVLKSRLKRLFDRQFHITKSNGGICEVKDVELEPSSVCLAKMVQNFIEDTVSEKPKCGRTRCNCFNGNMKDISDDELDSSTATFFGDFSETLKSLIPCTSIIQRNLLADTSKIVEKNKFCKRKDELRQIVGQGLVMIGYDAWICKSRWEKSSSYPAGEYDYLDVMIEGQERLVIDIDFRSEFEIARPTGNYKAILQSLPSIFVGDADRLQRILSIVSESAKLSLNKKGLHIPPWRKFEYMRSKWLSSHTRSLPLPPTPPPTPVANHQSKKASHAFSGGFGSDCGEETTISLTDVTSVIKSDDGFDTSAVGTWQPPAIKPRNVEKGTKLVVTGLASLFREKA